MEINEEVRDILIGRLLPKNKDIVQLDDAYNFMKEISIEKDLEKRLFSWLLAFGLTNPGETTYASDVVNMIEKYFSLKHELLGENSTNPLDLIDSKEASVIEADIKRSIYWFNLNCDTFEIEKFYREDAYQAAYRILALLSLSNKNLIYIQGYDRFMFYSYLLSISLSAASGIEPKYTEGIAFFLTEKLLILADIASILDNPTEFPDFQKLDKLIAEECPSVNKMLKAAEQSSFHFDLRWRLLLFCDEHTNAKGLLLIWDHCILNKDNLSEFTVNLALAHIKQVKPNKSLTIAESIQRYRNWDEERIINDTYNLMNKKSHNSHKKLLLALAVTGVCVAGAAIYYQYRKNNSIAF